MNTRPEPSAGKKTAFVIVLLISPLLLLFGLELATRGVFSLIYGVPGKSYGIYRADPVIGHFPAPNTYNHLTSLNDGGFRNNEDIIAPRSGGAQRVIAYGGSTTFCPKLSTEACWPNQLQKRLRAGDGNQDHQVLNGGVVLWSLGHVLERAKRDLPTWRPDTVIIYSGFNEDANAGFLGAAGTPIEKLVAEGRYGMAASNYDASGWLHLNSILFKIVRGAIVSGQRQFLPVNRDAGIDTKLQAATAPTATEAKTSLTLDQAILKNYLVVLERTIKLVRDTGAEPIFVIQANLISINSFRYSRIGAKTACELGVRVLDARDAVASYPGPKSDLFSSSIHYSAVGAAVLADYLYDRLYKREGFSVCDKS